MLLNRWHGRCFIICTAPMLTRVQGFNTMILFSIVFGVEVGLFIIASVGLLGPVK
jgi:hypothetical protein